MKGKSNMKSIEQFLEPRDIYEKIGGNASELSQEEHGFICGLIKTYRPERIVEPPYKPGREAASQPSLIRS